MTKRNRNRAKRTSQELSSKPTRATRTATTKTRDESNNSFNDDNVYYRSKTNVHTSVISPRIVPSTSWRQYIADSLPNCKAAVNFRFVRNLVQPVIQHLLTDDKIKTFQQVMLRRIVHFWAVLRFTCYLAQDRLLRAATAVKQIAGLLAAPIQPLLLSAWSVTTVVNPTIDTSPLVRARQRKESYETAILQPIGGEKPSAASPTPA